MKQKALWWVLGYLTVFLALSTLTRCGAGVGEATASSVGVMKF